MVVDPSTVSSVATGKATDGFGKSDLLWRVEHLGLRVELRLGLSTDDVVELSNTWALGDESAQVSAMLGCAEFTYALYYPGA